MPLNNWTITIVCAIMQKAAGTQIYCEYETEFKGRMNLVKPALLLMCTFPQMSHFLSSNSPDWTAYLVLSFPPTCRLWLRSMCAYVCKYRPLCDASFALKTPADLWKIMSSLWVYERLSGNSALLCKHHLFIYLFKNLHSSLRACLFGGVNPSLTQLWGLHLWRSAMKA